MLKNLPFSYPETELIIRIALDASKAILEIYKTNFNVDMKVGNEPVTIADKEADRIITSALKKQYPNDRILSEEAGLHTPDNHNNRTWFIDPIDGTKEFIKKNGEFAIQIGLAKDEKLDFGLIYQPIGKNLYVGARGQGCHWHSPQHGWKKLEIIEKPSNSLILAMSRSHPSGLAAEIHNNFNGTDVIVHGGVGLKLMSMAKNNAHYYLNDANYTKAWDIASPELLFTEAGGAVSDLRGQPFSYNPEYYKHDYGLLATVDKDLHNKFISFLSNLKKQTL